MRAHIPGRSVSERCRPKNEKYSYGEHRSFSPSPEEDRALTRPNIEPLDRDHLGEKGLGDEGGCENNFSNFDESGLSTALQIVRY